MVSQENREYASNITAFSNVSQLPVADEKEVFSIQQQQHNLEAAQFVESLKSEN